MMSYLLCQNCTLAICIYQFIFSIYNILLYRLNELQIISKMRTEETEKTSKKVDDMTVAVNKIKSEFQTAVGIMNQEKLKVSDNNNNNNMITATSDLLLTASSDIQSAEMLESNWQQLKIKLNELQTVYIQPTRNQYISNTKTNTQLLSKYDVDINKCKEKAMAVQASINSIKANVNSLTAKNNQLLSQKTQLLAAETSLLAKLQPDVQLKTQLQNNNNDNNDSSNNSACQYKLSILTPYIETAQSTMNAARSDILLVETTIKTTQTNIIRLKEVIDAHNTTANNTNTSLIKNTPSSLSPSSSSHDHDNEHDNEHDESNCPTCGQSLPFNQTQGRYQQLQTELLQYNQQKAQSTLKYDQKKQLLDTCLKYKDILLQLKQLLDRCTETETELQIHNNNLITQQQEATVYNNELIQSTNIKSQEAVKLQAQDQLLFSQLTQYENEYKLLMSQEQQLRVDIDKKKESDRKSQLRAIELNTTATLIQERYKTANNTLQDLQCK